MAKGICLPAWLPAAARCLLMLRIYASCLRLFNQLFSVTRVRLARSRSLFNYSCTALAALGKFVILWVFLNCFSPASSPFISRRHWEFSFAPSLCRCTRLRRLLQDHKWGTKFSCSCVCTSLCLTLCVGVLLRVSVCVYVLLAANCVSRRIYAFCIRFHHLKLFQFGQQLLCFFILQWWKSMREAWGENHHRAFHSYGAFAQCAHAKRVSQHWKWLSINR